MFSRPVPHAARTPLPHLPCLAPSPTFFQGRVRLRRRGALAARCSARRRAPNIRRRAPPLPILQGRASRGAGRIHNRAMAAFVTYLFAPAEHPHAAMKAMGIDIFVLPSLGTSCDAASFHAEGAWLVWRAMEFCIFGSSRPSTGRQRWHATHIRTPDFDLGSKYLSTSFRSACGMDILNIFKLSDACVFVCVLCVLSLCLFVIGGVANVVGQIRLPSC